MSQQPPMWNRHGRHPAAARHDAEPIRWLVDVCWITRHFVDETCACKDERFDLWAFGGRRFIRKTIRRTGKVYYSDLMRCAHADEIWQKLMEGKAR